MHDYRGGTVYLHHGRPQQLAADNKIADFRQNHAVRHLVAGGMHDRLVHLQPAAAPNTISMAKQHYSSWSMYLRRMGQMLSAR